MLIELVGSSLIIRDPGPHLAAVRSLPSRQWNVVSRAWHVPHLIENYDHLVRAGVNLPGYQIPYPTRSAFTIDGLEKKKLLVIRVPYSATNLAACKALPDFRSYVPQEKAWVCRPSSANIEALRKAFPTATWTDVAKIVSASARQSKSDAAALVAAKAELTLQPELELVERSRDYPMKTTPFAHQARGFLLSRDLPAFALLMEQRTGKTKLIIDTAGWQHLHHEVNGLLVVCPNGVKPVWPEEIETHLPTVIRRDVRVHDGALTGAKRLELETWAVTRRTSGHLDVLVMNIEAFATPRGVQLARSFLATRKCLMVVDESSKIKTPGAARTKALVKLGKLAAYRRILTGTPVTQSPLDVYSQFKFLDDNILGFSSFYAFRNRYALLGGWNAKEIIGYTNLDELQGKIAAYAYRVTRDECYDMPQNLPPMKWEVDLSPEQKRLYKEMASEMLATHGDGQVASVSIVLTQMQRLQQIVGGFLPVNNTDPDDTSVKTKSMRVDGPNPKIAALHEIAEMYPGKIVVWARYRPEIEMIVAELKAAYGDDAVVDYYGGTSQDDRIRNRRAFNDPDSPVRFFVGNQTTAGMGLNLVPARTLVYFSNTFSLEDRLQSQDRPIVLGMDYLVAFIDIVAKCPVDRKIIRALREKKNLADLVTGDTNIKEWL